MRDARVRINVRLTWATLCVLAASLVFAILNISLPQSTGRPYSFTRCPALSVLVVAYNRSQQLHATLNRLSAVRWHECEVSLGICIDGGGSVDVLAVAEAFAWENGPKLINLRSTHVGLAENIVSCWETPSEDSWALIVEDDVAVGAGALEYFMLAWDSIIQVNASSIGGIALNRIAVNQYCVQSQLEVINRTCSRCGYSAWTPLGMIVCEPSFPQVLLAQIPSSWGAFYKSSLWRLLQEYMQVRKQATLSQQIRLQLVDSMSNSWENSWKRYMLELITATHVVIAYIQLPRGVISSTERANGMHTGRYDSLAKCFFSTPVEDSAPQLTKLPVLSAVDYCGRALNNVGAPDEDINVVSGRGWGPDSFLQHHGRPSRHDNTKFRFSLDPELVIVSSVGAFSPVTKLAMQSWVAATRVVVVVFAPSLVCARLRDELAVSCVSELGCRLSSQPSPLVSCMLRTAFEAFPNAVLYAFVNGDIAFPNLRKFMQLHIREPLHFNLNAAIVDDIAFVGQRKDCILNRSALECAPEHHSPWGIDYFFLSPAVVLYACSAIQGFAIGRVRWDNQLLGSLLSHPRVTVYDATNALVALHISETASSRLSHAHADHQNLQLATSRYRLGRITNVPWILWPNGTVTVRLASRMENESRVAFDMWVERQSRYSLSSSGNVGFDSCVCSAMLRLNRVLRTHGTYHNHCTKTLVQLSMVVLRGGVLEQLLGVSQLPTAIWQLTGTWWSVRKHASKSLPLCCVDLTNPGNWSLLQKPTLLHSTVSASNSVGCITNRAQG